MALHHLFQLLGFFKEAGEYASPDEDALAQAGADAPRQASYHKRIVAVSVLFGLMGAALGVYLIVVAVGEQKAQEGAGKVLLAPLAFAAGGLFFGVSLMCLLAPRSFLTGPVGQKWMKLIGTQSTAVARVACFLFTLLGLGFITFMAWAAWSDMQ
ncbi:MAG TPA: hypothetical protein HPP83_05980 [Candidatus Hydrogenedentes bacterium]|nr:hypothetical protein [Candidatus Hydrogenedentota bacterium]